MSTIGTVSYLITVWGLIFCLIFGKPLANRIRRLEKKERRLMAELKAIGDSFVPGNLPFSHAGWVLLCIANGTCRVSARRYKHQDAEGIRMNYQRNHVNAHSLYKICRDLYGHFGEEGTFERLEDLSEEQWGLLDLDRQKFVAPDLASDRG